MIASLLACSLTISGRYLGRAAPAVSLGYNILGGGVTTQISGVAVPRLGHMTPPLARLALPGASDPSLSAALTPVQGPEYFFDSSKSAGWSREPFATRSCVDQDSGGSARVRTH